MGGHFTTKVNLKHKILTNHKTIFGTRNPDFCQTAVCAQHEQCSHLVKLVEKIQKCKFEFRKARLSVIIFPEGVSPLRAE
jgi:hypothetical protein